MTFNTGNPIGSTDYRDLSDNAEALDKLVNGAAATYPDRFGVARKSFADMEAEATALAADLANSADTAKGAALVGFDGDTVRAALLALQPVVGTFTPVLTFATPGDLAVTYSTQVGAYTKIGRAVHVVLDIQTSSFTHTTASGMLRITGLPFTSLNTAGLQNVGAVSYSGYTDATRPHVVATLSANSAILNLTASGSGVSNNTLSPAQVPSGGTVILRVSITYNT